jgi:cell division septal protein FtsQ
MASSVNLHLKYKSDSLASELLSFKRKKGRAKTKKIQRKRRLTFKHMILHLILIGLLFFALQQSYLFLISWEKLNIREVHIACSNPQIQDEVEQLFKGKELGNILLLDINQLQDGLMKHRWIKEVGVRKIFPLSVKIDIKVTKPVAIVKKDLYYMIDEEGVMLEQADSLEKSSLPLLIDSGNFKHHYHEKVALAWACLSSLEPKEREQIGVMDLDEYENVIIKLRNGSPWLKLGNKRYQEKFRSVPSLLKNLKKYGELEHIDLRFPDRFIIKVKKV